MSAILRDLASGRTFELGLFCLIGRGEGSTLRLVDGSISRQHASIRREASGYWLVDLGSANGTYVNDTALTSARRLVDGDRLQFGTRVMAFEQSETLPVDDPGASGRTQIALRAPEPARATPMTLLVADLKGFTELSARLPSGEVADLLRHWYVGCETVLRRHGASIDKFIGDCVFAYWHQTDPQIRRAALSAAVDLREIAVPGDIVLDCRVGLHCGPVALGAMGKGVNTALGDAVNMTFRIEALTRVVDEPILASSALVAGWAEARGLLLSRGHHRLKGYAEDIEVFALA
jgi:adenylate cyclase